MSGLTHMMTVAGPWGDVGCCSGLYMLAKLWPEGRDFSKHVSLLPDDLPKELIRSVRHHEKLTCHCSNSCAGLPLISVPKLPCPVQVSAGAPPLCVAIEQRNVSLVRSVSRGACCGCCVAWFHD